MSDRKIDEICLMFGFCSCGQPKEVVNYILKSLQLIKKIQDEVWKKTITWEKYHKEVKKHYHSEGAEYLMYYVLDKNGYTEHGGSVPGWLTDKGKQLLKELS